MAQARTFHEVGSMVIKKGVEYNPSIIKEFAPSTTIVKLSKGNIQYQKERDKNGELVKVDKDKKIVTDGSGDYNWLPTSIRGIKVMIADSTITYPPEAPNTEVVWEYGFERLILDDLRITPSEDGGIITYGWMEA